MLSSLILYNTKMFEVKTFILEFAVSFFLALSLMFKHQRTRWNYKGLFNDGNRQWVNVVTLLLR